MDNVKFSKVIKKIEGIIEVCNNICFYSVDEAKEYSLEEIIKRINSAKSIQGQMDGIIKNEYYHILGMGDLTDEQILTINKKLKTLLMFRPYIKPLACWNISIPTIPEETSYRCKNLDIDLSHTTYNILSEDK